MRASVMILAVVVGLVIQSCSTTPARNLDAHALWRSAESRHSAAVRDVAERQRLQNDYATIIRLSRDGDLRGRAFVRLAELDVAL